MPFKGRPPQEMSQDSLLRNTSWLTLISGVERVAAVVQTVLIARALGITAYGVYGLIFGTIGLTASIAGLQMGLTATVFLARYRDTEKSKAAFVIAFVNRYGFAVALVFVLCAIPFAGPIAWWLVGKPDFEMAIVAGCLLVAFSVVSGIQDGVIQGFEDFRSLALARLVTTAVTLACIYPAPASNSAWSEPWPSFYWAYSSSM
jgi:O-antigen/teichoic acid export membrane protein